MNSIQQTNNQTQLNSLTEEQLNKVFVQTPQKYIKQRKGPGGKMLSYVEAGYVIMVLNNAFGHMWNWKITEQQIGKTQVWVKGTLTIKLPGIEIEKDAYGGSDIKENQKGEITSIADDLKAASSDALKKAASMLGIASDVYFPQMDMSGTDEVQVDSAEYFSTLKPAEKDVEEPVFAPAPCIYDGVISTTAVQKYAYETWGLKKALCFKCQKEEKRRNMALNAQSKDKTSSIDEGKEPTDEIMDLFLEDNTNE